MLLLVSNYHRLAVSSRNLDVCTSSEILKDPWEICFQDTMPFGASSKVSVLFGHLQDLIVCLGCTSFTSLEL